MTQPPDDRPQEPQIPVRITRLRDVEDQGPDYIAPLGAAGAIVAVLGMTCLVPAGAAYATARARMQDPDEPAPAGAIDGPTVVSLLLVLAFCGIAVLGLAGGIGTILRRNWGRLLLLAYAALVLVFLATSIYFRLAYGIGGLTETAPRGSALVLNLTCVFAVIALVAGLMIWILRYFTLPHVVRRFR